MDSTETMGSRSSEANRWKAIFPPARWMSTYEARWLTIDLLTGIRLGAYALPVGVAYASLAGSPPQLGIDGNLLGGIGSSSTLRRTVLEDRAAICAHECLNPVR